MQLLILADAGGSGPSVGLYLIVGGGLLTLMVIAAELIQARMEFCRRRSTQARSSRELRAARDRYTAGVRLEPGERIWAGDLVSPGAPAAERYRYAHLRDGGP